MKMHISLSLVDACSMKLFPSTLWTHALSWIIFK